jgi:hypothetical protein
MWQAQILTPFTGAGTTTDPFRPQLSTDYPALVGWADITGTPPAYLPPAPNLYVVEATCDVATLDVIEADARYQIISAEEVMDAL